MKHFYAFAFLLILPLKPTQLNVAPYNPVDQDAVVEMVAAHDTQNTYMSVASNAAEKKEFMARLLNEHPEGNFVLKDDNGHVIGFLTTTKRKAPSRALLEELRSKGPEYRLYIQRLEARPNLPEASDDLYLRCSVIIAQQHREKGFALQLIKQALGMLQEPDSMNIEIDVLTANTAVRALCKHFGFSEILCSKELGSITLASTLGQVRSKVAQ